MSTNRNLLANTITDLQTGQTKTVESVFTSGLAPDEITIERLYDGVSGLASQQPSSLDSALAIQFGAVQGTPSDPIQTLAQGGDTEASILRINEAGTYRIKTAIQYGRETSSGTAILNFRVTINGVQAGRSINQRLQNANTTSLFTDEAWVTVPAGIDIVYEVIRDSNGNNSGGLIAGETSGSTGWNEAPSASVRVERWSKQP
tara:strand:- start:44918 stop:45526 length:609 start_codon:yes stop_codon:yes gene_type:complete